MLLITLGLVGLLFIVSYRIFDKDLLAPPTVVALSFFFGTLCCLYNEIEWGLDFSPKSTLLISCGILSTMVGGVIGVFLSHIPNRMSLSFIHDKVEPQEIRVNKMRTVCVIAFQIIALFMLYIHIRDLTGYSDWMVAVATYRVLTGRLADVDDLSIRMPILTRNITQISGLLGIVYAYIVGNNLIASKKKLTMNWIPIILYTITTFMQGDRSNMLRLWVVGLVTAYTIHRRKVGWCRSKETNEIIRKMIISIVAIGVIFFVFKEIVGRESELGLLDYVTFYGGSPIAVLNQIWEEPIVSPDIFGQRTLFYFNQSLTAIIGWPGAYNFYYPFFTSANGTFIGNAPTAFRPAFVELGLFGFIVAMVGFGIFFTFLYCRCRKKRGDSPIDIHLLVYAYVAYVFFMYFYSTFFDFLSHVFIKYIIEMLIIRWLLVGWQIKVKFRTPFS